MAETAHARQIARNSSRPRWRCCAGAAAARAGGGGADLVERRQIAIRDETIASLTLTGWLRRASAGGGGGAEHGRDGRRDEQRAPAHGRVHARDVTAEPRSAGGRGGRATRHRAMAARRDEEREQRDRQIVDATRRSDGRTQRAPRLPPSAPPPTGTSRRRSGRRASRRTRCTSSRRGKTSRRSAACRGARPGSRRVRRTSPAPVPRAQPDATTTRRRTPPGSPAGRVEGGRRDDAVE